MELFKKEKFYMHGHCMKFLIDNGNYYSNPDPCKFCPFAPLSGNTCDISGPLCASCVDFKYVLFCEIKFKRF